MQKFLRCLKKKKPIERNSSGSYWAFSWLPAFSNFQSLLVSLQFDLGCPGEMNDNFYLASSGACVRWALGSGDAGLSARGLEGKGFPQLSGNPAWQMSHTAWNYSKLFQSSLSIICPPHITQGMGGSQSTFLGICLSCAYRSCFQTTGVETPLDTGGASYTWGGCTSNPEVKLQSSPQSQMGIKAKHLIAWQILYCVCDVFMCNYWRRYKKSSRIIF